MMYLPGETVTFCAVWAYKSERRPLTAAGAAAAYSTMMPRGRMCAIGGEKAIAKPQ